MKHEEYYSLDLGGPKNLVISWEGEGRDMIIILDNNIISEIPNHKDIMDGKEIILPDGRTLGIKLNAGTWNSSKLTLSVFLDCYKLNYDGSILKSKKSDIKNNITSNIKNNIASDVKHDNIISTPDDDLLAEIKEEKIFETACNYYIQGKYDLAKNLFQRKIDINHQSDEAITSQAQLFFLKTTPYTRAIA